MTRFWIFLILCWGSIGYSQSGASNRDAAEYYLAAYANHYGVPLDFARAVVEQESGWHACAISSKGAAGLMQLMPDTAVRLGVRNRCDIQQNISGGIRYLAWLLNKFHGELRLVRFTELFWPLKKPQIANRKYPLVFFQRLNLVVG
ncbi:MAG TPA: lytic transglycosylase domain-containing protein [Candidatus Angelobacter sp.]|nr:lytic transglycosylase domain-containing protein [Candidatus Angelobacter sp.]